MQIVSRLVKSPAKVREFTLREYYEKRNTVLVLRANGGLGDILVHRMIFQDFKSVMPDARIVFACPQKYHDSVADHPYIDRLIDSANVNLVEYPIIYHTSNACCRYELAKAPFSGKNRSDIWANHCGVELTHHDMHFNIKEEIKREAKEIVEKNRDCEGPAVLFTPISAMLNKNLNAEQITATVEHLRKRGFYVYSSHTQPIPALDALKVPILTGPIRKWMGYVWAADCVVSVDTAALHMAGGLNKPMVGIFSFTDGKVYARYYPKTVLVQKHRDNGDWPCGPCYNWACCSVTKKNPKPCLTQITPAMIVAGIDEMLGRFPEIKKNN